MKNPLVYLLTGFIKVYQRVLSPLLPPTCIYSPTCSHYGIEALKKHGALKGTLLTAKRILRCHSWAKGGHDPVP